MRKPASSWTSVSEPCLLLILISTCTQATFLCPAVVSITWPYYTRWCNRQGRFKWFANLFQYSVGFPSCVNCWQKPETPRSLRYMAIKIRFHQKSHWVAILEPEQPAELPIRPYQTRSVVRMSSQNSHCQATRNEKFPEFETASITVHQMRCSRH